MSNAYVTGSVEYLTVTVTADVQLDAQSVALSLDDGATWLTAEWLGQAGTTRKARTNDPVAFVVGRYTVLFKVSDNPEVPLIRAGQIIVSDP